ncbi:MAG TPA: hypothetical protein VF258_03280 [Luteolibacter sp.]
MESRSHAREFVHDFDVAIDNIAGGACHLIINEFFPFIIESSTNCELHGRSGRDSWLPGSIYQEKFGQAAGYLKLGEVGQLGLGWFIVFYQADPE